MATTDTSIYQSLLRPAKSVDEFSAEADARDLGRLQLLLQRGQVNDRETARADQQRLLNTLRGLPAGSSDEDFARVYQGAGMPEQADKLRKSALERDKLRADVSSTTATADKTRQDADKARIANGLQMFEVIGQMTAGVKDQASYDQARAQVAQQFPELAAKMAPTFDPQQIAAGRVRAMSLKDQLEQEWKAKGYDLQVRQADEVGRHNTATERLTASGQAQQERASVRADARARDMNSIQRDLATQAKQMQVDKLKDEATQREQGKTAAVDSIANQISIIDKAMTHPGKAAAVGFSSVADPRNYIPGTEAKDFQVVLDQIGGAAFLQAFQSLKGGGAITEMEGKKAQDAIARLSRSQSEGEFDIALKDLSKVMRDGYKRLSGKAFDKEATPIPAMPTPADPNTGAMDIFNAADAILGRK